MKNDLLGLEETTRIQDLMQGISASLPPEIGIKLFEEQTPTLTQTDNIQSMSTEKNNSPEYAAVAATLGLKENYEVKDVIARINS